MEEQFERIFEKYNRDIFRLIFSYTLNIADTKDILQDTFMKYYKNINKINCNDEETKKWLMKVSINNIKNYKRNNWHKKVVIIKDENYPSINSNQNLNVEFIEMLNKLNEKYRVPIYLFYYSGYKIDEIAKILSISESAVKMRLNRAKVFLKKEMEMVK